MPRIDRRRRVLSRVVPRGSHVTAGLRRSAGLRWRASFLSPCKELRSAGRCESKESCRYEGRHRPIYARCRYVAQGRRLIRTPRECLCVIWVAACFDAKTIRLPASKLKHIKPIGTAAHRVLSHEFSLIAVAYTSGERREMNRLSGSLEKSK
jgi:hypothetical protein